MFSPWHSGHPWIPTVTWSWFLTASYKQKQWGSRQGRSQIAQIGLPQPCTSPSCSALTSCQSPAHLCFTLWHWYILPSHPLTKQQPLQAPPCLFCASLHVLLLTLLPNSSYLSVCKFRDDHWEDQSMTWDFIERAPYEIWARVFISLNPKELSLCK